MVSDLAVRGLVRRFGYRVNSILLVPGRAISGIYLCKISVWTGVLVGVIHPKRDTLWVLRCKFHTRDATAADFDLPVRYFLSALFTKRGIAHIGHQRLSRHVAGNGTSGVDFPLCHTADDTVCKTAALLQRRGKERSADAGGMGNAGRRRGGAALLMREVFRVCCAAGILF